MTWLLALFFINGIIVVFANRDKSRQIRQAYDEYCFAIDARTICAKLNHDLVVEGEKRGYFDDPLIQIGWPVMVNLEHELYGPQGMRANAVATAKVQWRKQGRIPPEHPKYAISPDIMIWPSLDYHLAHCRQPLPKPDWNNWQTWFFEVRPNELNVPLKDMKKMHPDEKRQAGERYYAEVEHKQKCLQKRLVRDLHQVKALQEKLDQEYRHLLQTENKLSVEDAITLQQEQYLEADRLLRNQHELDRYRQYVTTWYIYHDLELEVLQEVLRRKLTTSHERFSADTFEVTRMDCDICKEGIVQRAIRLGKEDVQRKGFSIFYGPITRPDRPFTTAMAPKDSLVAIDFKVPALTDWRRYGAEVWTRTGKRELQTHGDAFYVNSPGYPRAMELSAQYPTVASYLRALREYGDAIYETNVSVLCAARQ